MLHCEIWAREMKGACDLSEFHIAYYTVCFSSQLPPSLSELPNPITCLCT